MLSRNVLHEILKNNKREQSIYLCFNILETKHSDFFTLLASKSLNTGKVNQTRN